ncbi:MAG: L-rhamnose/proton symporter RhaT [Steroidobacteraceae bacterium]
MVANPLVGVLFHWLGGTSAASFYVPYKRVQRWSWEIYWIAGGTMAWLVAPWVFAALRTSDLPGVLHATPFGTIFWCYFWGAMWGLGSMAFGLAMRYLGLSLGMAVILGLTTVIGTLGPPLFHGKVVELALTSSGQAAFVGIALAVVGILIVARAGQAKDRELGASGTTSSIAEFDLRKGLLLAVFSGVLSSCFAFGLDAGEPIRKLTLAAGTGQLSQGLPVLCVVLAGGFTTNFLWCLVMIIRNRSAGDLIGRAGAASAGNAKSPPLLRNYALCALAGILWYLQFFFYTMGESQMGRFGFSSWTLHMASIILFSTLWGFALGEWATSSRRTRALVWIGITTLVGATMVIGVGNYLAGRGP